MNTSIEALIPRDILFADPQKTGVNISPNGQYISYLAPYKGNLNIWIAPIATVNKAKCLTATAYPVKNYWWAATSEHILFIHDEGGDENWQLHGCELACGHVYPLTPKGAQANVVKISRKNPHQILLTHNGRDKHYQDVYKLDLTTRELTCVYQNNTYWNFIADEDLYLKVGIQIDKEGGALIDISTNKTLARITQHDLIELYFYRQLLLGLSADSETLYFLQSLHSNTSTLSGLHLATGNLKILGSEKEADICEVLLDVDLTPCAFATNYERKKWCALQEAVKADFIYLQNISEGDLDIVAQSGDNQAWIISFTYDDKPIAYYHYLRKTQTANYLFDSHSGLENYPFTKMQSLVIPVQDGFNCVSYLSLPLNNHQKPAPLVLLVHGGPCYRDFWGFNPTHQWLTNRGYAVLSVNYRGSSGFGKAHLAAGNGQWGRKIQEDLIEAVQWAIENEITTNKVAIMGRSFGGYCTLVGLTMTPEVFCCGVDIVGPANLETMIANFPPYWKTMTQVIHQMLGCDPQTEQGKAYLKERSPLFYASDIKSPLLIAHGVNDVQVLQTESDEMVKAMTAKNIPVTYAIFPDEGHQLMHPGNRQAFYALAEAFLAKNLQGKVEPADEKIHTSMIVKVDDFALVSKNFG